jgi:hypothetical protein
MRPQRRYPGPHPASPEGRAGHTLRLAWLRADSPPVLPASVSGQLEASWKTPVPERERDTGEIRTQELG